MRSCVLLRAKVFAWGCGLGLLGGCALAIDDERPTTPQTVAQLQPRAYDCKDGVVIPVGGQLAVGDERARLERHARDGDHYVMDREGARFEYIVPADPREDVRMWAEDGERDVCTARGGHSDLLGRWIRGDSVAEIATALGVPADQVRWRLIGSIRWARSRIGYDRATPEVEPAALSAIKRDRPAARALRRPPTKSEPSQLAPAP